MGFKNDPKKMEFYKETSDDWCGNYKLEKKGSEEEEVVATLLVRVRAFSLTQTMTRILVSGTDDYAYFKDYETDDSMQVDLVTILKLELLNIQYLTLIGFTFF